ncbi:hypothetical protein Tco_1103073 [Tanacetum coccineum]
MLKVSKLGLFLHIKPIIKLTEEICATNDFKEYETVFIGVDRDKVTEATILSLTLHKTALAKENIAKVQEKLDEEEIEKMVEGDEDEESYASEFANSMINDDVDDSGTKIEPGSHKEHLEIINDDDDQIEKETKDEEIEKEKKHDDDEKIDEVVMEKDDDDDDEGVKEKCNVDVAMGSMEFRKEKMQTSIPSPMRSPRKVSSSDKTVTKEFTRTVSPTTATTSKDSCRGQICSHIKNKFITYDFFMGKIREVLDHCNKVVPELTFAKTNEMINKHTTLNVYPTSSSNAGKSTADLQQQLYLKMKSTPKDQAADPELWEILKAKFEKQ